MTGLTTPGLLRAADNLVNASFAVAAGESVLITADYRTDMALIDAVAGSVSRAGALPLLALAPPLPYQGRLSDPYVGDALKAAAAAADVWLDFCFPYHAGSGAHDAAMQAGRCRYCLLATPSAAAFERLYGALDFAAMLDFNIALSAHFAEAAGEEVRFTCPRGTDMTLTLDEIKLGRKRVNDAPGLYTVPGVQSFYPVRGSARGRVVIQALFDERYRKLREPIVIDADDGLCGFSGGGAEDRASFDRALRRAGGGAYGDFIHFAFGFHPAAMLTGETFIEDIRVPGSSAIGMGLPWWEPGGGENHPDGVALDQSLWIGDRQLVDAGVFRGPETLQRLYDAMTRRLD